MVGSLHRWPPESCKQTMTEFKLSEGEEGCEVENLEFGGSEAC